MNQQQQPRTPSSFTTCVDHDRNLTFRHPADWVVAVEPPGDGRPDFLTVWSPAAPDGGPGVLVSVSLMWHDDPDLRSFVDRRLAAEAGREGFALRGRSAGPHPVSRLPAVSLSYDLSVGGVLQRKEMIFVEASPGVVLAAAAMCREPTRHLWTEACKVIFGTLAVADPLRPPVPASGGLIGVGLGPGHSDAMRLLWMLLDVTAKRVVAQADGEMREDGLGVTLGPAAEFEARVFLLYEMASVMLRFGYPEGGFDKVVRTFIRAITGRSHAAPLPPEGPLARYGERWDLYLMAEGADHIQEARERMLLLAELLVTSGTGHTPVAISPAAVYERRAAFSPAKGVVVRTHLPVTAGFRISLTYLFEDTPDVEALSHAEASRRIDRGHVEAEQR